jgi:hypothetical protein
LNATIAPVIPNTPEAERKKRPALEKKSTLIKIGKES